MRLAGFVSLMLMLVAVAGAQTTRQLPGAGARPAGQQQPGQQQNAPFVVDHSVAPSSTSSTVVSGSPIDVREMIARLSAEADHFERTAYRIAGREVLRQTVPEGARTGRGLRGNLIRLPGYRREIVSEYGFVSLDAPGGSLREVRRVIMVDGQQWQKETKSLKALARDLMEMDDKAKQKSLERFEDFGLNGFVTDLGQLLLLFARGNAAHYEFTYDSTDDDGNVVFVYQQVDGPEGITIYGETPEPVKQKLRGKIWVNQLSLLPSRISLDSQRQYDQQWLSDRSWVSYEKSEFGMLLPVRIQHEQYFGPMLLVNDEFIYSDWKRVLPEPVRSRK